MDSRCVSLHVLYPSHLQNKTFRGFGTQMSVCRRNYFIGDHILRLWNRICVCMHTYLGVTTGHFLYEASGGAPSAKKLRWGKISSQAIYGHINNYPQTVYTLAVAQEVQLPSRDKRCRHLKLCIHLNHTSH